MKHPRRALAALATILSLSAVSEAQAVTVTTSGKTTTYVSTFTIPAGAMSGSGWRRNWENRQVIYPNDPIMNDGTPGCEASARYVSGTNSAIMVNFNAGYSPWSPWLRINGVASFYYGLGYRLPSFEIWLAQADRSATVRFRLVDFDNTDGGSCLIRSSYWP